MVVTSAVKCGVRAVAPQPAHALPWVAVLVQMVPVEPLTNLLHPTLMLGGLTTQPGHMGLIVHLHASQGPQLR